MTKAKRSPDTWPRAMKLEVAEGLRGDPDGVMRAMVRHDLVVDEVERLLKDLNWWQCEACECWAPLEDLGTEDPLQCVRCRVEMAAE